VEWFHVCLDVVRLLAVMNVAVDIHVV